MIAGTRIMRRPRTATVTVDDSTLTEDRSPSVTLDVTDGDRFTIREGGGRLGELLVQREGVAAGDIVAALSRQQNSGKRLGALLIEMGVIDEQALARVLAEQFELPLADLRREAPDPCALNLLPERLVRTKLAVPLRLDGDTLHVVVAEPENGLAKELTRVAGTPVQLHVAPAPEVRRLLDRSYRAISAVESHVRAFEASALIDRPVSGGVALDTHDDAPVVQVVNLILTQAVRDRASDIHLEPQDDLLRVRFRIDGALHDALSLPGSMAGALISRVKILAEMNIVERRRPQDGKIAIDIDGTPVDIRVATAPTIWGESCVLRLLDKSRPMYRLSELGMPPSTHDVYSRLVRSPFGMVICAGPTGSGKTTTLYATVTEINDPAKKITTIEDPVEYVFPSINQIQTNEQAGITFASGLRSILRQDPDVILVGEVRDAETARIAVQSSLTGHFVLSSLHATDAVAALHRFLDMGIEAFLVASSVVAVLGQRLVRRICPACRVTYQPTDEEMAFYLEQGGPPKDEFWRGDGCAFCSGTGYQDRIGVYELLRITPEMKRLIVGWAGQDELRRLAVSQGMSTLQHEGVRLVANDVTTIGEVIRTVYAF